MNQGNPNFGLVRTLMVGVKSNETHQDLKGEVWFNEPSAAIWIIRRDGSRVKR
jgi:hypothetical protein